MMIIIISNVNLYVFSTGPAIEVFKALLYCDSNQLSEEHDRQLGERASERERETGTETQSAAKQAARQPDKHTLTHSHFNRHFPVSQTNAKQRGEQASWIKQEQPGRQSGRQISRQASRQVSMLWLLPPREFLPGSGKPTRQRRRRRQWKLPQ